MVDSTIPYEVMMHLQVIDARLDALEAGSPEATTASEETTEKTKEEETSPPTRSARGRS